MIQSLRRYFRDELEQEIGEMPAKFLLEYYLREIAPYAYNKGVKDAESHVRTAVEDLSGVCYEPPMTYWSQKKK